MLIKIVSRPVLGIREATSRTGAKVKALLPPRSRIELVMSGAFRPPDRGEFAHFGAESWVVPPAVVRGAEHVSFGTGVVVMEHCEIRAHPLPGSAGTGPLLRLGDGTRLARFVTIWATVGVHIGDRVSSSDYVSVIDCWRQPGEPEGGMPPPQGAPVVIEDGAYLGCRSVVGPGVTVGAGAFVGEGAVVLSDVPAHAVVYGNPARVTRHLTQDGSWAGEMFGGPR